MSNSSIQIRGVLERDIAEANPMIFGGELYRLDCIRWACFSHPYYRNTEKRAYFRRTAVG